MHVVCGVRVRGKDKLLNVQPLRIATAINTLCLGAEETKAKGEASNSPVSNP